MQQPGEPDVVDHVPGRSSPRAVNRRIERRPRSAASSRRPASRSCARSPSRARSSRPGPGAGLARREVSSSTDISYDRARPNPPLSAMTHVSARHSRTRAGKGKGPPCGGPLGHGKRGCPRERICDFFVPGLAGGLLLGRMYPRRLRTDLREAGTDSAIGLQR